MKRTIISIALLAALVTLAVSCQKDSFNEETTMVSEQNAVYKVWYSIDGVTHQVTLLGDDAWHDFLNRMFALAESGHRVSFRIDNSSSQVASTKDIVTYTTTNHDDAYKWADMMGEKGYTVTIEYNERTGVYTCTAYN